MNLRTDALRQGDVPTDAAKRVEELEQQLRTERAEHAQARERLAAKGQALSHALQLACDSEQRLNLALRASGEGVWNWDAANDLVRIDMFEFDGRPLGLTLSSTELAERVHADDVEPLRLAWWLHVTGVQLDYDVGCRLREGGTERWVHLRGRALERDEQGRALRITGTIKDVGSQRRADESLRLMAHAFSSTHDALVVADEQWRVIEANDACCRLAGIGREALVGSLLSAILPSSRLGQDRGDDPATWSDTAELLRFDGCTVPVGVTVTRLTDGTDGHGRYIVSLDDISQQRRVEARLEHLAQSDNVTDLPNRAALEQHLDACLAVAPGFALMYVDLDGVKEVNDSFGHDAGDEMLRMLADRLRGIVPEGAFLSRWGGDEFVIVLPAGSGETEVRSCAQGVIATLSPPLDVRGHEVSVTPGIGAVLAPRDGTDAAQLLRKADSAMSAARKRGRGNLAFYDSSLDTDVQRRVRMHSLLRVDAERNGFTFVAQPKVDRDGMAVGAELLMRWPTTAFGMVSPVEFIPMAEKIGLIGLMGRHALHAAAQLASRGRQVCQSLTVAVNLSPKQLLQRGLDRQLLLACERAGVAPAMLELELTESALVDNMDVVEPLLQRLRQLGFSLALDDFGTGYSSLSYLRHLPFNKIKIDRSFVMDIDHDHRAARLLAHMVQLCSALGMSTVAEGVETESQFHTLRDLGVQEYQGYYFARPLPLDDWIALMSARPGEAPRLPA